MNQQFLPFELELYQSLYEHQVEYNLADSSVKCLGTRDWLTPEETEELLSTGLFYPEVNGTQALREAIAALYPGATPQNILVTVGASQANSMVCQTLLSPGDEVIVMSPGYRQVWGLAQNAGCTVKELPLRQEAGWRANLDDLDALVTAKTRLVAIVNPNNPTGSVLTREEMQRVVDACARVGAWLHADEVYRGTERGQEEETPSFWGMYDRVICVNSLSKAYGIAGLRIGWAVADQETIEALWRRHEYAVIAAAAPSMTLATIALKPEKRRFLLERQKQLSRDGWAVLEEWIKEQNGLFSVQRSPATSIGFVRYHLDMPSHDFAEEVRKQASVLIAPGGAMGAEHHVRITLGYEPEKVRTALGRVAQVAHRLPASV